MGEEYLFMILILTVLSMLVIANTFHIYKLTQQNITNKNLMDMQEFNDIHPMIKELYQEAIVNGVFYIQNMIINDVIKMNNIDKWYNSNKDDILNLIKLVKKIGMKQYDKNKKMLKIPPSELSKLVALDLKTLIQEIEKIESLHDIQNVIRM